MLFETFTDHVTRRQHLAWNVAVRRLQRLDDRGTGTGWLFHGTDHLSATHILRHGFNWQYPDAADWPVYWGSANIAAGFAERKARKDSPPVLVAARTVDVLASGTASVDETALETGCAFRGSPFTDFDLIRHDPAASPPGNWRESYLATGCLVVSGGHRVNGLRVFGISSLPLHPGAPDERRARLEGGRATVLPHPDETLRLVVEENARLFPDRWTQPEASLAELRGQAAPGDTHSGNAPAFLRTA